MPARRKRARQSDSALSWIATGLAGVGLILGGFGAGVLLGIVSEEPSILTGHWAGRSERVALQPPVSATPRDGRRVAATAQPPAAPARSAAADPRPARGPLPPVAAAAPGYAVQVGSFSSSDSARAMKRRLAEQGYESFVSVGGSGAGQRWRVRVGPFAARARADRVAGRLEGREGLATWIVTLGERTD